MRATSCVLMLVTAGCVPDFGIAPKPDPVVPGDTEVEVDSDTDVVVDTDIVVDTEVVDTDVGDSDTDRIEVLPDVDASTVGTRFWLGFSDNIEPLFNGAPRMAVVVSATVATQGAIVIPRTSLTIPFTLAAGEVAELSLPAANWYDTGSGVTTDLGVLIEADQPISAWAVHYRLYFSDATLLLPEPELGDDYLVVAQADVDNSHPSQFLVVATANGTQVQITPSALTADLRPVGVTYTVTLEAGQTYQVQAFGDLTGTRVHALNSEPIAVFGGAQRAEVGGTDCRPDSTLWDQIPTTRRAGTAYVVVPFGEQGGDEVKVVATLDNTVVQRDCGTPLLLDAGESASFRVSAVEHVTSDKPILVAQLNDSQSCNSSDVGDPSFQLLQPTALVRDSVTFLSVDDPALFRASGTFMGGANTKPQWVNVTAPASLTTLTIDGVERVSELAAVPGDPSLVAGALSLLAGPHTLAADAGVSAHAYGFSDYDAYTVHLGYDCLGCATDLAVPYVCP